MNRSLIPEPFLRQAFFLIATDGQIAAGSLHGVIYWSGAGLLIAI